jgi:riboflavin kinase/FMN adenylyltransferase
VINSVVKEAPGVPTVVSFWPHPREVLHGDPRLRLDLPSEKASLLAPLGVEQLVMVPFDRALAALSAEEFVEQMLLNTLQARRIAVGANFRFGRDRQGDTQTLQRLASAAGVEVVILPILEDEDGRMSSSRIRAALNEADLKTAKSLMGRPYRFRGCVVHGRGLGRKLGWPTANLQVDGRKFLPCLGVYAAWAWIDANESPLPAVMNLGPQPTVDPTAPSAVEVHLLDQEVDLEGCELVVEPVLRIRGQQRFENLESLSAQISLDASDARNCLKAQSKEAGNNL